MRLGFAILKVQHHTVIGFSLFLMCALAGCRSNEVRTQTSDAPIEIFVDSPLSIQNAKHRCELAEKMKKHLLGHQGRAEECIGDPDTMEGSLEVAFLNAFQKNLSCKGTTLVVGTAAKVESLDEKQRFAEPKYRLCFYLSVDKDGDFDWNTSSWDLLRVSDNNRVHGSMSNLEKETTDFCSIVRGDGGGVRHRAEN